MSVKHRFYFAEKLTGSSSQSQDTSNGRVEVDQSMANLVSSELTNGNHKPVLDIDMGVLLKGSETPGHFHLFIDKQMSWRQYERLLIALGEAGILEPGYVSASLARGATFVATKPWKHKENS